MIIIFNMEIVVKKIRSKNYENSSHIGKSINNHKCNPILNKSGQYYAIIDGHFYPRHVPLFQNRSLNFSCLNQGKTKKILLWNNFFHQKDWWLTLGAKTPFSRQFCPVTNCELLADKSRINESDLILLHVHKKVDDYDQLQKRLVKKERWVYVQFESPAIEGEYGNTPNIFSFTSTYRIDSDFPDYYQTAGCEKIDTVMRWEKNDHFNPFHDYSAGKLHFAAAVISRCNAPSKRDEYIQELKKYIAVDVFGRCGNPCPNKFTISGHAGDCKDIIGDEYRFCFSFENSICQ